MINKIPVIGWTCSIIAAIGLSVPFWLFWSVFGMGTKYFSFLPVTYQSIPFWHCFSLFIIIGVLRWIIKCLTPQFVYINISNDSNSNSSND